MTQAVKLGRKLLLAFPAFHWAVKVGDTWYELDKDKDKAEKNIVVKKTYGFAASSLAGFFDTGLPEETEKKKTDVEIDEWIDKWLDKFACEFMDWLTESNFICPHKSDAADYYGEIHNIFRTFARAEGGNAIAKVSLGNPERIMTGRRLEQTRLAEAKVQVVAGQGLGAWVDASLLRLEAFERNMPVGVHIDINANTGAGIRNGNLDVHFLGLGGSIGADGLNIDTPVGGVSACSVM